MMRFKVRYKSGVLLGICTLVVIFFSEFAIYYLSLMHCSWPILETTNKNIGSKVLVISDTHLVGYILGNPFDRIIRDWQMKSAFRAILWLYDPDLVFILGDLLDEGQWASIEDFQNQVKRFNDVFSAARSKVVMVNVVGNHDIGFHKNMHWYLDFRFQEAFTSNHYTPPVYLWSFNGNHFVIVNSVALEEDGCNFCELAHNNLLAISSYLKCLNSSFPMQNPKCLEYQSKNGLSFMNPYITSYDNNTKNMVYSQPLLLQHYPLYRKTEEDCPNVGNDIMPTRLRSNLYIPKIDCISVNATQKLLNLIRPRLVLSGHTHYSCTLKHQIFGDPNYNVTEWSVASFNWRNLRNPSFLLLHLTPDNNAITKCYLSTELQIVLIYIAGFVSLIFIYIRFSSKL